MNGLVGGEREENSGFACTSNTIEWLKITTYSPRPGLVSGFSDGQRLLQRPDTPLQLEPFFFTHFVVGSRWSNSKQASFPRTTLNPPPALPSRSAVARCSCAVRWHLSAGTCAHNPMGILKR